MTGRRSGRLAAVAAVAAVISMACGGDQSAEERFCALVLDTDRIEAVAARVDPDDPARTREAFGDMAEHQRDLLEVAPEEVRADVARVVSFTEEVAVGLADVSPLDGGRPAVFDELEPEHVAVTDASNRLAAYVDAECGTGTPD